MSKKRSSFLRSIPMASSRKLLMIGLLFLINPNIIAANEALKLSVINIGKPLGYKENGQAAGIYFDIMKEIESLTGFTFKIQAHPFKRMSGLLKMGEIDCSIFFTSEQRKSTYLQVAKVVGRSVILVTQPDIQINTLSDIYGKDLSLIHI